MFKTHKFDGEHYWEIWTKWYSKKYMRKLFNEVFQIEKEYSNPYWAYSYNYILKSKKPLHIVIIKNESQCFYFNDLLIFLLDKIKSLFINCLL